MADRLLTFRDLRELGIPVNEVIAGRRHSRGDFPSPVVIGKATVRWRESAVQTWISKLPSAGGGQ